MKYKEGEQNHCDECFNVASCYCNECQKSYCDSCFSKFHLSNPNIQSHIPIPIENKNVCKLHPYTLDRLYCMNCMEILCPTCLLEATSSKSSGKVNPHLGHLIKSELEMVDYVCQKLSLNESLIEETLNKQINASKTVLTDLDQKIRALQLQMFSENGKYQEILQKEQNFHSLILNYRSSQAASLVDPSTCFSNFKELMKIFPLQQQPQLQQQQPQQFYQNSIVNFKGTTKSILLGHSAAVRGLCFLQDERLCTCSEDNTCKIWDVANNGLILGDIITNSYIFCCHQMFNQDIAIGSYDGNITVFSSSSEEKYKQLYQLEGHSDSVYSLCQVQDGRLFSGSADFTGRLWNMQKKREDFIMKGHNNWISSVLQLQDGRLATGSADKMIMLWSLQRGICEKILPVAHTDYVRALIQLSDGTLASASNDGTVILWDVHEGKSKTILKGHQGKVTSLCQLADGRILSGSDDGTLKLWNLKKNQQCEMTFTGHTSGVNCVAQIWSKQQQQQQRNLIVSGLDGFIVSGSNDKTIRIWN